MVINRISQEDADTQGLRRFFTRKLCRGGHLSERYVSDGSCVACTKAKHKRNHDPEKSREYQKAWRARNRNAVKVSALAWRTTNPEKQKAVRKKADRKYRETHPEKFREINRKRAKTPEGILRKRLRGLRKRLGANRFSESKLRMVGYTPAEFIRHLESTLPTGMNYEDSKEAGYHLDHIVPLAFVAFALPDKRLAFRVLSDLKNLKMIPGAENMTKAAVIDLSDDEHTELIQYLGEKYGVVDEFIAALLDYQHIS